MPQDLPTGAGAHAHPPHSFLEKHFCPILLQFLNASPAKSNPNSSFASTMSVELEDIFRQGADNILHAKHAKILVSHAQYVPCSGISLHIKQCISGLILGSTQLSLKPQASDRAMTRKKALSHRL